MGNLDDKTLAILGMVILGLAAIFTFNVEALSVITHIITGMAGIVTGRVLGK